VVNNRVILQTCRRDAIDVKSQQESNGNHKCTPSFTDASGLNNGGVYILSSTCTD